MPVACRFARRRDGVGNKSWHLRPLSFPTPLADRSLAHVCGLRTSDHDRTPLPRCPQFTRPAFQLPSHSHEPRARRSRPAPRKLVLDSRVGHRPVRRPVPEHGCARRRSGAVGSRRAGARRRSSRRGPTARAVPAAPQRCSRHAPRGCYLLGLRLRGSLLGTQVFDLANATSGVESFVRSAGRRFAVMEDVSELRATCSRCADDPGRTSPAVRRRQLRALRRDSAPARAARVRGWPAHAARPGGAGRRVRRRPSAQFHRPRARGR